MKGDEYSVWKRSQATLEALPMEEREKHTAELRAALSPTIHSPTPKYTRAAWPLHQNKKKTEDSLATIRLVNLIQELDKLADCLEDVTTRLEKKKSHL